MTDVLWEDTWVLLAVKYAQGASDGATSAEVVRAADFINHTILLPEEIEHAVDQLSPLGLLDCEKGIFSLGPEFGRMWSHSGAEKRRSVHAQLEAIGRELKIT